MADDENLFLKTLNFFSPANWWEAVVGAATGKSEDLQGVENPSFQQRVGSVATNSQFLSGTGTAITKATENIAPLKFVLDFGNRTTDSFFGGFQYNDAMKDTSLGTWAEGWRKSWDSWGTQEHVSAGSLIGAAVNEQFGGQSAAGPLADMNPFVGQGRNAIDALSRRDWYGNIAGGVSDLAAGFISPVTPAALAVKAVRSSSSLSTIAAVESTADTFNRASKAGTLDALSMQRGRSFFASLDGAAASGESYAARLRDFAREAVQHSTDNTSAMNFFGPRMENATEASKRVMATTAVMARELGEDMATHVTGNAWLMVMGSEKAAAEVKSAAPLVFDALRNATGAPEILGIQAKAQEKILAAFQNGGDIRLSSIMDEVFETPAKKAQHQAILGALDKAKLDAEQAKTLRGRMASLKPSTRKKVDGKYVDNFDVARLKESRLNAETQYKALTEELKAAKAELKTKQGEAKGLAQMSDEQQRGLTSKQALQDGADALKSKDGRDALAAFGPYKDAEFYAKEAGAGTARVSATEARIAEIEQRLMQAKSDRDLLASTPPDDPDALAKWRADMGNARAGVKDATSRRDLLSAMERVSRQQLKDDAKAAKALAPSLNATNTWLKDIWELGETGDAARLSVSSSILERSKTAYRDYVGRTYMFQTGEYSPKSFFHVHPKEQVAAIGTAYGRSAVNTHDIYKGQQELGMYMRKSGAFTGDEIQRAVNEFIGAGPGKVALVVEKYNDLMVERMLLKEGIDPATVKAFLSDLKHVGSETRSYLTGRLAEADASGQKWVKTNEFPGADSSDALHMVDSAYLRPHLSDTVQFADPHQIKGAIQHIKGGSWYSNAGNIAGGAIDKFNYMWKMYNLLRPGLFFRNMMDTGLRASLLMGAAGTLYSTHRGSVNFLRNTGVRVGDWSLRHNPGKGTALQRFGARQGADEITKHMLGDKGVEVALGGGKKQKLSFYELQDGHATAASVAALRGSMTRGASLGEGLLGAATPLHNKLIKNLAKWDKFKANDLRWPEAYREHAQALLASPTARRMVEQHARFDDMGPLTGQARINDLFSDAKVRDEYNKLAADLDMTREQFIEQIDWEMENMFPEPGMAETVLAGRLKGKAGDRWIEEHFPVEQRFDVPGYESILPHAASDGERAADFARKVADESFRILMDEPDFWLVRHPVAVNAFSKQVKLEASKLLEARRAKFGDDAELTVKDIAKIDARARTYAVSTVKKYMYDSTYSTEMSQGIHRWAPFFNPWYDAMRAYSKLAFDDPQRLQVLAGLWNSPDNISQWLPEPLVVDVNGNEVRPGEVPTEGGGERFYVLSSLLGGKKPFGIDLKLRQSSFNTILMGNTPWLPGWGPSVAVPLAATLNTQEDVALWLSSSDNLAVKTLMESLWPDGQVPRDDQIWKSLIPPTWRKFADLTGGEGFWRNVQYGMNQRYITAMQNGEAYDPDRWLKEAEKEATNAGIIAAITQGIFGVSSRADVAGQFYVDEMRQIQAIPIETVKAAGFPSHQAMFAGKHKEAGNLTWTFTRNDTGINATVQAQQSASKLRPLIEKTPELGWFILGGDNVGGEFSQTAYNQQRDNAYGTQQAKRRVLDPGEVMRQTVAGQGWDQYLAFVSRVEALAAQHGFGPDAVSRVKSAFAQQLGESNPTWFEDYSDPGGKKLATFFNNADQIIGDPALRDRQDIGMYAEYRAMRQQILDALGLKTLSGTGEQSAYARSALKVIGTRLASQNIGFQQMWERVLAKEVEALATDTRFGVTYGDS